MAIIRIPAIGVDKVVVAGTGRAELARGPGLYASSPMPGAAVNLAIAGHRTTYGGPFLKIGELQTGDRIEVLTKNGLLAYEVARIHRVAPTDLAPLAQSGPARLTLTTCDPPGSATRRLVVEAGLVDASINQSVLPTAANPTTESNGTEDPVLRSDKA
ncbi:MAG: sortase [Actinomycetota bacterium]